jgi:anti-sigma factor (TIGR02949 family)
VISCSEAVRQLWEYLDRDLDASDRERVEEHLSFCRRCCGEVEFAEQVRGFLASAARPDLPGDVEARLVGFLDALEEEAT